MKKAFTWVERISFVTIIAFAFIGMLFTGTLLHELSHWNDYKDIVISEEDYICLLDVPADGPQSLSQIRGAYYYSLNPEIPGVQEKASKIDQTTELKAYSIQFVGTVLIFLVSISLVLWRRTQHTIEPTEIPVSFYQPQVMRH